MGGDYHNSDMLVRSRPSFTLSFGGLPFFSFLFSSGLSLFPKIDRFFPLLCISSEEFWLGTMDLCVGRGNVFGMVYLQGYSIFGHGLVGVYG